MRATRRAIILAAALMVSATASGAAEQAPWRLWSKFEVDASSRGWTMLPRRFDTLPDCELFRVMLVDQAARWATDFPDEKTAKAQPPSGLRVAPWSPARGASAVTRRRDESQPR